MILVFACSSFFALPFAKSDENSVSDKQRETFRTLSSYCQENNQAIANSEVRIVRNHHWTPSKEQIGGFSSWEFASRETSRAVSDRKTEQLLFVSLYVEGLSVNPGDRDEKTTVSCAWRVSEYRNGKGRMVTIPYGTFASRLLEKAKPRVTRFNSFRDELQIPNYEFWNWHRSDVLANEIQPAGAGYRKSTNSNVESTTSPDGTVRVQLDFPSADQGVSSTRRFVYLFDGKTRMPRRRTDIEVVDGVNLITHAHEVAVELKNGVYRTIRISETDNRIPRAVDDDRAQGSFAEAFGIPRAEETLMTYYDRVGSVDLEWLQFNETALQFPSIEEVARDEASLARFLNVDLIEMDRELKRGQK
jgi:hypothetical protein